MMNFPSSPSIGQTYQASANKPTYKWTGSVWSLSAPPNAALPESSLPLTDNIASPGSALTWSRADHVHASNPIHATVESPAFTGTFGAVTFNTTSDLNLTGAIMALAKGHKFGSASGQAWSAPLLKSDANIVLYDVGGENWAGMGTDTNGTFWVRTGNSTRVSAAMIATTANVGFAGSVWTPSPANGTNNTQWATTAFVQANQPVGGPYLPITGGTVTGTTTVSYGHVMPYRNGSTGVYYFTRDRGDRYLYFNGAGYYFNGNLLNTAAGRIWGDGDFTRPVTGGQVNFVGDWSCPSGTALTEPAGGSVMTGCSGNGQSFRFRQKVLYVEGTWYVANFA
jgi:hypothetical protein